MPQLGVVVKIMFLLCGTYAKPQNVKRVNYFFCKYIKIFFKINFFFIFFSLLLCLIKITKYENIILFNTRYNSNAHRKLYSYGNYIYIFKFNYL